jgi:hypothetical protein
LEVGLKGGPLITGKLHNQTVETCWRAHYTPLQPLHPRFFASHHNFSTPNARSQAAKSDFHTAKADFHHVNSDFHTANCDFQAEESDFHVAGGDFRSANGNFHPAGSDWRGVEGGFYSVEGVCEEQKASLSGGFYLL